MTYDEINLVLKDFYKENQIEPGYLILPQTLYDRFVDMYEVDLYEHGNIFEIMTTYGPIYLEGRQDVKEPTVIA